ncbi:MAG: hypothetical protein IT371_20140 [Deltaproteobacteria bacterium]|nr:hypothetical protein [Deltaproteobacteria bacterium]
MPKQSIVSAAGPYPPGRNSGSSSQWRVAVELAGGKRSSRGFASRELAVAFMLKHGHAPTTDAPVGEPAPRKRTRRTRAPEAPAVSADGSITPPKGEGPRFWAALLEHMVKVACRDPSNGDVLKLLRASSAAAAAAARCVDQVELEQRVARVEAAFSAIVEVDSDGTADPFDQGGFLPGDDGDDASEATH